MPELRTRILVSEQLGKWSRQVTTNFFLQSGPAVAAGPAGAFTEPAPDPAAGKLELERALPGGRAGPVPPRLLPLLLG